MDGESATPVIMEAGAATAITEVGHAPEIPDLTRVQGAGAVGLRRAERVAGAATAVREFRS
jgi:hypothetical protein